MRKLTLTIMVGLALLAPAAAVAGLKPSERQVRLAGTKAVKIVVRENGWYSVSRKELTAAGLSGTAPASRLQLYADGSQVPILMRGVSRGRLGAKGSIEFYGQARDVLSTDARTYWLVVGAGHGQRIPVRRAAGGPFSSVAKSFPFTAVHRDYNLYLPIPNGKNGNYFGARVSPDPLTQAIAVTDLDPTAKNAALRVALHGLTLKAHRVKLKLNDLDLGEMTFANQVPSVFKLSVPGSAVKEGTNTLTLQSLGGELDWSVVDNVQLTYAHRYRTSTDVLNFTVPARNRARITGFTQRSVRLLDVTDRLHPRLIQPKVRRDGKTYTVTVAGSAQSRRLIALTDARLKNPASVFAERPSTLHAAGGADEVIISHRRFIPALAPLKALRQSQGLKTRIVDVTDVYDEFDYGIHGPGAVRTFLRYVHQHWKPSPRYVLLVGDGSTDPRNYLNKGANDLVPAKLIDTYYNETASDGWFADFDKNGIAELAVGRIPVRTAAQAKTVVSKIVGYEQAGKRNPNGALLVADKNEGWDFETATTELGKLVAATMPVTVEKRSASASDAAAKAALVGRLASGPAVVNYFGHGAPALWAKTGLLETKDVAKLTNAANLSLYVMMTCNNAYFVDPVQESLSEALLLSPHGGAVASVASSGYVDAGSQTVLDREFFRLLLANPTWRLGDTLREAKKSITDMDLRRTELIIGDPATQLHF
jgi:hypothetical protein